MDFYLCSFAYLNIFQRSARQLPLQLIKYGMGFPWWVSQRPIESFDALFSNEFKTNPAFAWRNTFSNLPNEFNEFTKSKSKFPSHANFAPVHRNRLRFANNFLLRNKIAWSQFIFYYFWSFKNSFDSYHSIRYDLILCQKRKLNKMRIKNCFDLSTLAFLVKSFQNKNFLLEVATKWLGRHINN